MQVVSKPSAPMTKAPNWNQVSNTDPELLRLASEQLKQKRTADELEKQRLLRAERDAEIERQLTIRAQEDEQKRLERVHEETLRTAREKREE